MTVTVGAYSLIVPDPNEQYIPALSMKVHESYNNVTKLNDIALIQVVSSSDDSRLYVLWIIG